MKYGRNSRIDLLLQCADKGLCYVEVKNVHFSRRHGLAEFPNSVTERGAKHLAEMSDMVRQGHRAVMVYLIQRGDAKKLAFARDVDPTYGAAFDVAARRGRRGHRASLPHEHRADRGGQTGADRRVKRLAIAMRVEVRSAARQPRRIRIVPPRRRMLGMLPKI